MKKDVVAFLTEIYAVTGQGYIYQQAELLKNFDAALFSELKINNDYAPLKKYSTFIEENGNSFLNLCLNFSKDKKILSRFYQTLLTRFFTQNILRSKAKLIHAHFGTMGYRALPIKSRLKLPMVTSFYGVDTSFCMIDTYWKPRMQQLFKEGEAFITISDAAADRMKSIGCPQEKLHIIDIGIPIDEYPYRAPQAKKEIKFLNVARFIEKKGHSYLIDAFKKVLIQYPQISLTIMGNGPLKKSIEAQIKLLGLCDKITLIDTSGRTDFFYQFKEQLNTHDVFISPTVVSEKGDEEGGPPLVIINAMSVGLPVISTTVGANLRALSDGVTGLLAPPEDSLTLALKMTTLIENPPLWENLAQNARKLVETQYDIYKQTQKLEMIYEKLINTSST